MKSARDVMIEKIGQMCPGGEPSAFEVDHILSALKAAGYRILAPGEIDPETVERCAHVADAAGDTWSNSRDAFVCTQEAAVDAKCAEIAGDIRALSKPST